MATPLESQIQFTKSVVVQKIVENNEELRKKKLSSVEVKTTDELNGFMSNILFVRLSFEGGDESNVAVKLQKGSWEVRKKLKADIQFGNEIVIYRSVVPAFLEKFGGKFRTIDPQLWCPRAYVAEVGSYPELSANPAETLLAVENLSPLGYRLGGRSHLSEPELRLMTRAIAQYHACSYALHITKDPLIEKLRQLLTPFVMDFKDKSFHYTVLYDVAFERLFEYIDRRPEELDGPELKELVGLLRQKYGEQPLKLMNEFGRDDHPFSVMLHGDYNRNNVLFRYDEEGNPTDLRFIDFQETRYASPAIDLAFYFYMNIEPELLKTDLFERLLALYHENLVSSLCELLDCQKGDPRLETYSWEKFYKHFQKFAFYGGMVAIHFLPWMLCPMEECERLTDTFYADFHSKEFHEIAMKCGGDKTNERLIEVLRMATRLGHLNFLKE